MASTYPKTKSDRINRVYYLTSVSFSGGPGGVETTSDSRSGLTSTDSVFLGASPSGWKHSISVGANAGSVLIGSRYRAKPRTGSTFAVYLPKTPSNIPPKTLSNYGSRSPGVFGNPSTSANVDAENKARSKLLGSYINARNNFRGGNFLAEFRDTVHMLRHPVKTIFGSTMALAKRVRKIRRLGYSPEYRKRLGDAWLTYSFGLKPAFEDIKDFNKAIEALGRSPRFDSIPISGAGMSESQTSDTFSAGWGNTPGGGFRFARSVINTSNVKYYGAIGARPQTFAQAQESFGFDPYDIVPAVWEAVPWSFLVDYFVNINELLDAMRYANADLKWLMKGFRNLVRTQISDGALIPPDPALWSVTGSVGGGGLEAVYKNRVPVNQLPYPRFHFKIPGLGSLKWANVAALVAAINSSKPIKR